MPSPDDHADRRVPPRHVAPDDLALVALGEHPDQVEDIHLGSCTQCQAELDQLRAVVTSARSLSPEDAPTAPPERVWAAISAELGLVSSGPVVVPLPLAQHRRTAWVAAAAAVAGLVVGAGVTAAVTTGGGSDPETIVARTTLVALPDRAGSGDAEVITSSTGRELELDVTGLSTGTGLYEVWLLGADGTRLVSLGFLDGPRARFALPEGVDVGEFPVVDVSLEPADGNPAHSGDSIVRGTLAG